MKSHLQLNESYDQDIFVKVVDEIVAESTINIKKMRDYFEEFRGISEDIIESVKIKAAVRLMLIIEQEKVRRKKINKKWVIQI